MDPITLRPIGVVRSPFHEKVEAPRQATVARDVPGTIEILPDHEAALSDLASFNRIWVLFWFHLAEGGARAKVLPPRSEVRRGVFATRSPHRPNPLGMSAVRLERIEGRVLHVRDLDLLDGTPVLDLKPYLPYADAFPEANAGWLEERDPRPRWEVSFSPRAEAELAWIEARSPLDLRARIVAALALGPEPHAYRRIKRTEQGLVLAVKDWRVGFVIDDKVARVERITTGYRARELEAPKDEARALHRAFARCFRYAPGP